MTTAYTSLLGLALPVTGELSGTWGDTVNNSITSLLDSAIAGTTTLSADTTLTTTTGASNQARQAILLCTGHSANITITAPAQSKIYTVINASATYTVKIRGAGPTTGITIPVSSTATVAWNGSDFVDASGYINGNLKVNGTLTVSTLTSGRVVYASTSGLLVDNSGFTYAGTNLALTTGDMTIGNGSSATTRMFRAIEVGASGNTAGIAFGSGGVKGAVYGQSGSSDLSIVSGNSGSIAFGYATSSNDAGASANFNSLGAWTTTGLGIGTSSPSSILHISKGATSGAQLNITRSSATATVGVDNGNSIIVGAAAGDLSIRSSNANILFADSSGTESMRLASGNLGLGVTPSAWISVYKGLQINEAFFGSQNNAQVAHVQTNTFVNSAGDYKYIATNYASRYRQFNGQHEWYNAPSGTAGNTVTFTQAMTLDASGNLGIGTTSPSTGKFGDASCAVLVQSSDPAYGTNIFSSNSNNTKFVGFWSGHSSADSAVGVKSGTALTFGAWGAINGAGGFSEWGRFDSSGNLLVGTTTRSASERFNATNAADTSQAIIANATSSNFNGDVLLVRATRNTTNSTFAAFSYYNDGAAAYKLRIWDSGNVVNTNNSYGSLSDVKIKENIVDASPKLDDLMQVKVRNYNLIGDTQKQIGVVAQELEQVFPSMIDEAPDRDADGNDLGTTTKSVKYSVFVPMLIKAMQEQQAIITQLTARITALEGA